MFELLTKFLITHREVSIPSVGSFYISPEPARYDVADKIILPPQLITLFNDHSRVGDEQIRFMASHLNTDVNAVKDQLVKFGEQLYKEVRANAVEWKGIGQLQFAQNKIEFQPATRQLLSPVPAPRVIHENAEHMIVVGEREVSSSFKAENVIVVQKKFPAIRIAWWLLLLGVLFILYWFYIHDFSWHASGQSAIGNWQW